MTNFEIEGQDAGARRETLTKLSRSQLEHEAKVAGVEEPKKLSNKADLVAAILEAEGDAPEKAPEEPAPEPNQPTGKNGKRILDPLWAQLSEEEQEVAMQAAMMRFAMQSHPNPRAIVDEAVKFVKHLRRTAMIPTG